MEHDVGVALSFPLGRVSECTKVFEKRATIVWAVFASVYGYRYFISMYLVFCLHISLFPLLDIHVLFKPVCTTIMLFETLRKQRHRQVVSLWSLPPNKIEKKMKRRPGGVAILHWRDKCFAVCHSPRFYASNACKW